MIRSIMLALSGSPFTPVASRYAVEIAAAHQAKITGVSFLDVERLYRQMLPVGAVGYARAATTETVTTARRRVAHAVTTLAEAAAEASVSHSTIEREGDPIELLIDEWRYHDLTVFGLRGLFDYRLVPEPEDALNRLVSAGVRPILAVGEQYRPIQRILVATSGSLTSAKVLKRYLQMGLWPQAEIHLVHFGPASTVMRRHLERTRAYCETYGAQVASMEALGGHPRPDLLPYADRVNADLIVMGDSARSLLSRALFGDTALHLVRNA
ncbi:MAG: universal stress protein, partial [Planctomycetota bacterium]|nr:universal stress protein [Planctomycetota bacterium]